MAAGVLVFGIDAIGQGLQGAGEEFFQFVKEAVVLNEDAALIGHGVEQFDVGAVEIGFVLDVGSHQHADHAVFLAQRNGDDVVDAVRPGVAEGPVHGAVEQGFPPAGQFRGQLHLEQVGFCRVDVHDAGAGGEVNVAPSIFLSRNRPMPSTGISWVTSSQAI